MEGILSGAVLLAIFAFLGFIVKRTDPRFHSFRLASKGGTVFSTGYLLVVVASSYEIPSSILILGFTLFLVGFATMIIGLAKHAKIVFDPGEFDAKRDLDPGYDLPYRLCPHCKKIQIRMYHQTMKCPRCKGIIKLEDDWLGG